MPCEASRKFCIFSVVSSSTPVTALDSHFVDLLGSEQNWVAWRSRVPVVLHECYDFLGSVSATDASTACVHHGHTLQDDILRLVFEV